MSQATISPERFDTINRCVEVPSTSLSTVLGWADVMLKGVGGERILLSGIHEVRDDGALVIGAAFEAGDDSTVGDTFNQVVIPQSYHEFGPGDHIRFDFHSHRARRPGSMHAEVGSIALCWQKPNNIAALGALGQYNSAAG